MNKHLMNVCLILMTLAVIYTALCLPPVLSLTLRKQTDEMIYAAERELDALIASFREMPASEVQDFVAGVAGRVIEAAEKRGDVSAEEIIAIFRSACEEKK